MPDRKLVVEIVGDSRGLSRAFSKSSRDAQNWSKGIERAARGGVVATVGFRGLGRSVAFASGAFLGGAGFIAAARSSINAASDLNEQLNKTNVLFGDSAGAVKEWSRSTANSFGVSQRAALAAAGGFGSMLRTAGLTADKAAAFSRRLVELAADMASFNNIDPTEALDKLRSGLAGEAEPLRQVGVLLSETRVQQEAYRSGLAKTGAKLTEQQKVLARYALILKDTARQQGDFGRTSGGLANQQRILAAQVENLQSQLGQALLPDVLRVVRAINVWLSSSENQEKVQRAVNNAVKTGESAFRAFLDVMRPLAEVAKTTADAVGGTRNAIRLLILAMVVSKVVSFSGAITGLGTSSLATAGKVNTLRAALLRLGLIGVITLGVEVVLNRETIDKKVRGFLKGHHLGFLAGGGDLFAELGISANATLPQLEDFRKKLVAIAGADDIRVKALDKVIAKLRDERRERLRSASQIGRADPIHASLRERFGRKEKSPAVAAINDIIAQTDAALKRLRNLTKAAKKRAIADFGGLMDELNRAMTAADVTPGLQDNLRILQRQLAAVTAEIRIEGRTKELLDQRADLEAQIASTQRDIKDNQREAAQAAREAARERQRQLRESQQQARLSKQFLALNLTATGEQRVPGAQALRRRLGSLKEQVKGTPLDTEKTRSELARIAKVLSGSFGKVGRTVRAAILQMLNDIAGALDQGQKQGPLTKTTSIRSKKLLEGLGLTPDQIRELRGRLSNFNSGGVALAGAPSGGGPRLAPRGGPFGPIVVESHVTVELDGQKVGMAVTKQQQKQNRRNPPQKRGPNSGRWK